MNIALLPTLALHILGCILIETQTIIWMTAWPSKTSILFVPEKKSQSCSQRFEIHIAAVCSRQTIANHLVSGTDRIRCHSLSDNMWPQHDDVIKWKHVPRYWPFVRGNHRSPLNSPHKGQWRSALMFSLTCAWINCSVNNREAVIWEAIAPIMTWQ